jgi:DNA-binding NarL/FixJ family response regulator
MTTVVVVDDHPVVVAGIRAWCAAAQPPIEVIAAGGNVSVAWLAPGSVADVVVLDLQLDITGPAYGDLKRLVDAGRQIVVYTMRDDRETALTCLDIGAFTYLTKAEGEQHLVAAISAAANHLPYVPPALSGALGTDKRPHRPQLTRRQIDVLREWFKSESKEMVAQKLNLTVHTVNSYLDRVRIKYANVGRSLTIAVDTAPHPLGHRFAVLAATESGWCGGDSTYAVELAGHQRLWLFSDTKLTGDRWVHNCIVVEDVARGALRTVLGGTSREPDDLVRPPVQVSPDVLPRWLWTGHGFAAPDVSIDAHRAGARRRHPQSRATHRLATHRQMATAQHSSDSRDAPPTSTPFSPSRTTSSMYQLIASHRHGERERSALRGPSRLKQGRFRSSAAAQLFFEARRLIVVLRGLGASSAWACLYASTTCAGIRPRLDSSNPFSLAHVRIFPASPEPEVAPPLVRVPRLTLPPVRRAAPT